VQNVAPEALDDLDSVGEESSGQRIDVLANDTDDNGDALVVSGIGVPSYGSVAISGTTELVYTPANRAASYVDVFVYIVSDGALVDWATVVVSVNADDDAPTARAETAAPVIAGGGVATLDGSGSSNPEGGGLAYGWRQTGGAPVVLSAASAVAPTFTAPMEQMVLTFTLVVTDGGGLASPPDEVAITVSARQIYLPMVVRSPS
jgi:hypothetical protein